jgi:type II secretory pathway component PulK
VRLGKRRFGLERRTLLAAHYRGGTQRGLASPGPAIEPDRGRGQTGEAGFALVLALVVILVLSLITEAMVSWVSGGIDQALTTRRQADAARQMAEAEAAALYLFATRPYSRRGIELLTAKQIAFGVGGGLFTGPVAVAENYIRLDDQAYRLGEAVVRFQDLRGLINLNLGSADDLYSLLGLFDVPAENRGPLIAKLQDYIDSDSLLRLNGAEAPQYEDAGMPPPANAPLRTPSEVLRILDWDKIDGIATENTAWSRLTTTSPVGGLNINTVPRELLALIPMMNADAVERVIEYRREQPIYAAAQFTALTGVPMAEGPGSRFLPMPGNGIALTISVKDWPLDRRIAVRSTPRSPDRPWIVDYAMEGPPVSRGGKEPDPDDIPLSQFLSAVP